MKRIFYLLTILGIASTGYAQNIKSLPLSKQVSNSAVENITYNVKPVFIKPQSKSEVEIWTDDFSDQSTWVMTNSSLPIPWNWTIETNPSAIPNTGPTGLFPLTTTTASNGYALINSDGQPGNADGDGAIVAEMTTATPINLIDYPSVRLTFEHNYRWYRDTRGVRVSGDNGANWTTFEITNYSQQPFYPNEQNSENPVYELIDISEVAGGQSQVLIQFYYNDNDWWGWYWAVDDVSIIVTPDNDLKLTAGYYDAWPILFDEIGATFSEEQDIELIDNYEYSAYMVGQVRPLTFVGAVLNQGVASQNNTVLEVGFTGPDGVTETFMSDPYPVIEAGSDTVYITIPEIMPAAFADGGMGGNYSVSFSISADEEEENPVNNVVPAKTFSVNSEYMANDIGDSWSSYYPTLGDDVIWGNRFTLIQDQQFNFVQFAVINAAQGPTLADEVLTLNVRTGSVFADDGAPSLLFGEDDISYVTETSEISQGGNIIWITSFFPNDQPETFSPGEIYQAEVHVPAGEAPGIAWVPLSDNPDALAGALYDYADEAWFFLDGIIPLIRLGSSVGVGVEGHTDLDFKLSQNYPNPTTGNTRIDWELMVPAKNVRFSITDVTGKTVYAKDLGDRPAGVQESMELDLNLAAGNYQYGLTIGNQRIVRKMVVVK